MTNLEHHIPHFYMGGPDNGIATSIRLRDIADPSLKTAVFYKNSPSDALDPGNAGPQQGRWAPVVFEAEVDTIGYPFFQLGHMMFIDARKFIDGSARENFLATGYYGIKKITHRLSADDFSTTVSAIIQISEKDAESPTVRGSYDKSGNTIGATDVSKPGTQTPGGGGAVPTKPAGTGSPGTTETEHQTSQRVGKLAKTSADAVVSEGKQTHKHLKAKQEEATKSGHAPPETTT